MISNLEDFRNQQLIGECGIQTDLFDGQILPFLFHDISNAAFYMTIDSLRRMQQTPIIGNNPYCLPAVGLWFTALESYVSTIHKILQAHETFLNGASNLKATKIIPKFIEIISYINNSPLQNCTLKNQIEEFATFRNTLFHDLTFIRSPQVYHTKFASHANKLNEIDLIQAAIIAIDLFTYLRHTFAGVDLMPNIFINNQYEKVNALFDEVIKPAFTAILSCKGLSTGLSLIISKQQLAKDINIKSMKFVISYEGPTYTGNCSTPTTAFVDIEFNKAKTKRPISEEIFKVPNYMR